LVMNKLNTTVTVIRRLCLSSARAFSGGNPVKRFLAAVRLFVLARRLTSHEWILVNLGKLLMYVHYSGGGFRPVGERKCAKIIIIIINLFF